MLSILVVIFRLSAALEWDSEEDAMWPHRIVLALPCTMVLSPTESDEASSRLGNLYLDRFIQRLRGYLCKIKAQALQME